MQQYQGKTEAQFINAQQKYPNTSTLHDMTCAALYLCMMGGGGDWEVEFMAEGKACEAVHIIYRQICFRLKNVEPLIALGSQQRGP